MGTYKGFKVKKDSSLRGAYGETDFEKRVVRINKKKHKSTKEKRITPNKDGSENMATTIQHELLHVKYPRKNEKAIEKLARAMVGKKSPKQKAKLYKLVK